MPDQTFDRLELEANGLRFVALAAGEGPVVLCAHGFPETAETFDATLRHLAANGYRAVAPHLRGYWPSAIAGVSSFHVNDVAADLVAIAEKLSPREPVALVAHDWGALAAYRAVAMQPERFRLLVTIGIPHVSMVPRSLRVAWGLRHFLTFQWKSATVRKMRANDFAFVDEIYRRWAPTWNPGPEETAPVKDAFKHEGCIEGALGYYWDFVRQGGDRRRRGAELDRTPIAVPTTMVIGRADAALRPGSLRDRPKAFPRGGRVEWIDGVGHFVHRENFAAFARVLDAALRPAPS